MTEPEFRYCNRGPCWMEAGHAGECAQDGRGPVIYDPPLTQAEGDAYWAAISDRTGPTIQEHIETGLRNRGNGNEW